MSHSFSLLKHEEAVGHHIPTEEELYEYVRNSNTEERERIFAMMTEIMAELQEHSDDTSGRMIVSASVRRDIPYAFKKENAKRIEDAAELMLQIDTNSSEPQVWRSDSEYLMRWLASWDYYADEVPTSRKYICCKRLEEWMDETAPSEIEYILDPTQEPEE